MSSKTAAKTTKVPAKPAVAAKTSKAPAKTEEKPAAKGKKAANPKNSSKNAEAAVKRKAEQRRYEEALKVVAELAIVTVFDELTNATTQDKWTNAVYLHVLEILSAIERNEVRKEGDYNPYPAKNYLLYSDKVESSTKKRAVKTTKTEGGTSTASKKKAPLRRGQKVEEPEEHAEEQPEVTLDDSNETEEQTDEQAETKEKEEKKKNITTFSRDAKNYLGFLIMRLVDDMFSSPGGKNVKNRDDFCNFVYTAVTKDITSHVSRSVVATVNRMGGLVSDLPDRGVPEELNKLIGAHFKDRQVLVKFMGEFVSEYLKLVGYVLAHQLWVSRKTINQQTIESVVRVLDMGNHDYLVEIKVANDNEPDFGLSCGFYQDAHVYSDRVLPPKPVKEATAKTTKKPAKKAKAKEETEEAEEEEVEEEAEEEAEEEEVEEEEAEEEEAEEVEEVEEVEEEVEEEPEEEVKPKKSLKKLK